MLPSALELQTALDTLGLSSFRPLQKEAITALCGGQDVLVCLATGGGKSLMYQLPSIVSKRSVVIVSPLLSLAKDQVDNWNDRCVCDVPACCYNSSVSERAKADICRDLACGSPQLVYTTPESLCKDEALRSAIKLAVASEHICAVAVDEAHCVCEWGHEFRPAYLHLRLLRNDPELGCFGKVPFIALTATVTKDLTSDIVSSLGLVSPLVLKHTFNRPNIAYMVKYKEALARTANDLDPDSVSPSVARDIAEFIAKQNGASGIVYARKRQTCEDLASELNSWFGEPDFAELGLDVAAYHAGLSAFDRNKIQNQWTDGSVAAVVATVAFGMGIDKSDVRWVVHYEAPSSIEALTQESGRAGRDGLPSASVLYTSDADQQWAGKVCKDGERAKLKSVLDYCNLVRCRRRQILAYFGEKRGACNAAACEQLCDVCSDAAGVRAMQSRAVAIRQGATALADVADAGDLSTRCADADGAGPPCSQARPTALAGRTRPPAKAAAPPPCALWQKGSIYGQAPPHASAPPGTVAQQLVGESTSQRQRGLEQDSGCVNARAPSTQQAVLSRTVASSQLASSGQPSIGRPPYLACKPLAAAAGGAVGSGDTTQPPVAGNVTQSYEACGCEAAALDGGCTSQPTGPIASPSRHGGATSADVLTENRANMRRPALRKRPGPGDLRGASQRFKAPRAARASEPADSADAPQLAPGPLDASSPIGSRPDGANRGLDGTFQEQSNHQHHKAILARAKFVPPKAKVK